MPITFTEGGVKDPLEGFEKQVENLNLLINSFDESLNELIDMTEFYKDQPELCRFLRVDYNKLLKEFQEDIVPSRNHLVLEYLHGNFKLEVAENARRLESLNCLRDRLYHIGSRLDNLDVDLRNVENNYRELKQMLKNA